MTTDTNAPVRVNVYVAPKLLTATRVLADRRGATLSDVFRTALREYVVAELRKERDEQQLLEQHTEQAP